jgi:NitT/TauT family transport system permease protein
MLARVGLGLVGFAVFLGTWEALRWTGVISVRVFAFPSTLVAFLASRPALDGLGQAALVSARQFGLSFAGAGVAGVVLGLVLGWYRRLGAVLEPLLVATNSVSSRCSSSPSGWGWPRPSPWSACSSSSQCTSR